MSSDKNNLNNELLQLQKELFDLSARNPFVNVDPGKLWFIDEPDPDFERAKKIYTKARYFEKEYALKTSLLVVAFIEWKNQSSDTFFISPLLYRPGNIEEKKRIETTYSIVSDESEYLINPILRKSFSDQFNVELPISINDPASFFEELINEFNSANKKLERDRNLEPKNSWRIIEKKAVGLFNYKKSLLHRDYEKILQSPGSAINQLFSNESPSKKIAVQSVFLNESDESQKTSLTLALTESSVIQGPPGTGKSQTVVTLIKTLLSQGKNVLFVSEKRSALDVVYNRLKQDKLDHLVAYFNTEKDEKKTFYAHLKKAWTKATESVSDITKPTVITGSEQSDLFSFYPKKLISISKQSETSIHHLEEKLLEFSFAQSDLNCSGRFPKYNLWNSELEFLKNFEHSIKIGFGANEISDTAFFSLSGIVFTEPEPLLKLDKKLDRVNQSLLKINDLQNKYNLTLDLADFTRLAIAGSILGMVNKNQLNLIKSDHKHYKTFNTLAKKFNLAKNNLHQIELVNKKWICKPSISEITEITGLLKHEKKPKSILGILRRNATKTHDYFSDFSEDISTITKLQLLEELRTEWHLRGELEAIKIKIRHELNITNPDTEIDHILQVRSKLESVSQNEYISILEHENSPELIRDLQEIHTTVNQSVNLISYLFHRSVPKKLTELLALISLLKSELGSIKKYQHEIELFFKLNDEILNFIRENTCAERSRSKFTIHKLDAIVAYQNLLAETRFEPTHKNLSGSELIAAYETKKRIQKHQIDDQLSIVRSSPNASIRESEKLLEIPASKLKPAKKISRQIYKDEKRILLHELNKKQQHLAVKNLVESCTNTVAVLQPVWMMNPLSVAQHLPCENELFDVVIFDEASQVPLEDAIPAIYRAKQVIVVGDSQQMPPGQFFSTNKDVKTLLDQAASVYKNSTLKWHYRSQHPSLIEFSNRTFYDNELIALPPISNETAIELQKVEGIFHENKNETEAIAIAQYYKTLQKQGVKNIGIIAFSKEQQNEIERQILKLKIPVNEELVLRNLENVQGIEKEIILISIGYAKNKEGIFRKNFGPVNQEKGANRLNVLFTRAIKKMVVFTSVSSLDFKLSTNKGVTVLADFLKYVESTETIKKVFSPGEISHVQIEKILTKNKIDFTFYSTDSHLAVNCFIQHSTGKILLVDPGLALNESQDIYLLLSVLQNRFKKIKIVTSSELLQNRNRVEEELVLFF